jgi:hypothetical protein
MSSKGNLDKPQREEVIRQIKQKLELNWRDGKYAKTRGRIIFAWENLVAGF